MCSLFLLSCQSGDLSGSSPESELSNFFDAMAKKDMNEARKYVTKDSEGMLSMMEMGMNSNQQKDGDSTNPFDKNKVEFGKADIQGEKAYVPVTEKSSGETVDMIMKKEDGKWKVAFDMATLMEMAQSKMKEKGMREEDTMNLNDLKDSIMNNMSPEDIEKAKGLLDSLSTNMKNLSKEQIEQARKAMENASRMLEDNK